MMRIRLSYDCHMSGPEHGSEAMPKDIRNDGIKWIAHAGRELSHVQPHDKYRVLSNPVCLCRILPQR